MRRGRLSAVALALGLGACAHYAPAPQHPESFAQAFDARRLGEPGGGVWTPAELLSRALAGSPRIVEARAKYLTALAAARAAKAPPGPSLTLTAEYANETPHWGYSGAGDIPLDYGARRSVRITTANLQALQAFYDYGETVWTVRTEIDKAHADLTAAQAEVDLAQQSVQVRADRAERLERRVAAGQDAIALALTAQADAAAAGHRLAAARGRVEAALVALGKAVGVSPAALRDVHMPPLADSAPALTDLALWRRDAAASRRDVLRAVADYDIAEQALRLEVASQYPAVSLGPGYNYDHGVTKLPFSLSLALPPWDLNKGAIAQAEAARAAAGRSLEVAQANALSEVDGATAAFRQAWEDLRRTRERDVPAASRAYAAARRSQSVGETDRVDELAARAADLDAALALNDARHAAAGATADLEDALRRSFDPAETAVIQAEMTKVGGVR